MYSILGFRRITLKDGSEGYHVFLCQPISTQEGQGLQQFTRCFLKKDVFDDSGLQVGDEVVPELGTDKDGHMYVRNLSRKEVY